MYWRGYLSGTRCRLAYGPADATVSCFSKIQIGFTFLVLAHLGTPRKRAVKRVCVCVSLETKVKCCVFSLVTHLLVCLHIPTDHFSGLGREVGLMCM